MTTIQLLSMEVKTATAVYQNDWTDRKLNYCTSLYGLIGAAAVIFIMLLTILILSICLCRTCKRTKKQKLTEGMVAGSPEEADLHYAELQNLPTSNRGQCDGETCKAPVATQNSDYATVAELKGPEDGCCNPEEKEDDGMRENESLVEAE
ncbi:uncharacterized protein LOC121920745 isoform X2 [Sceloporus undulatus]|uniref:uncharacterized protein LOC121920745 isoform X2 n=1 Tax=Sceloporus undulatus TaxID=8520 RepID=UPI001C4BDCE8|nr:uncharacterized protein LOC121920745 isoform X2 [Sceloporus undulatus]